MNLHDSRSARLLADLEDLSRAVGVSGAEDEVRRRIVDKLRGFVPADQIETDTMGNVIVTRPPRAGGDDGTVVMLAAHMDEVGLMISFIESDGTLRFKKVGGIDDRLLPGKAVRIGPKGVPGVIGVKPIHLQGEDERGRVEEASQLFIDIGADSREQAERVVRVGDRAVFEAQWCTMGADGVCGKALDDRVGCTALLELLRGDYPVTVVGVFTVQEEVGLRGARVAAYRVAPSLAIVLEGTVCADLPGREPHEEATRLGDGAVLSVMDRSSIAHPELVRVLSGLAGRHGIPYQWRRTAMGGNDAGEIHTARGGVPSASVSVPCRYIHGPVALARLRDLEAVVRLVETFLQELPETGLLQRLHEERRCEDEPWSRR